MQKVGKVWTNADRNPLYKYRTNISTCVIRACMCSIVELQNPNQTKHSTAATIELASICSAIRIYNDEYLYERNIEKRQRLIKHDQTRPQKQICQNEIHQ